MEIKTLLRKGSDHVAMCQDHFHFFCGQDFTVLAVFDGCSSGLDSHFASNLYGKVLKGVLSDIEIQLSPKVVHSEYLVKYICTRVYRKLKEVYTTLKLKDFELLSTMVLAVITSTDDSTGMTARVMVSGDGLISVDGVHHIVDENNMPDYMAYHLEDPAWNPVDNIQVREFDFTRDFSVCSDGMMSFVGPTNDNVFQTVADDLLVDRTFESNEVMLSRKYNLLSKKYINKDDLSIVRLML